MNPKAVPYGWGCRFAKMYCSIVAEKGWGACIHCPKLESHPQHDLIVSDISLMIGSKFLSSEDIEDE